MIIEIMTISAPNRKRDQLTKVLTSLASFVEMQAGCLSCRLFHTWPGHEGLQMEARWDTQDHLLSYLQSDIHKRLLLLMELSSAPPALEFFAVDEFRGLNLVENARFSPD